MAQSVQIKKISWWHESVIDWMLEHPDCKLYECAAFFGVKPAWLSVVINSDCFKELWSTRRANHSAYISESLTSKTQALGHLVIEEMTQKIEKEKGNISLSALNETANTVFRSLGYGTKLDTRDAPQNQQNNFFFGPGIDAETLADSRRLMDELRPEPRPLIEAQPEAEEDEAKTA